MKTLLNAMLAIALLSSTLVAQWNPLGPYGRYGYYSANTISFATLDTMIFFTDGREVFRSVDQGRSWTIPGYATSSINKIFKSDTLLFVSGTTRVMVSSDRGETWNTCFGSDTLIAAANHFARVGNALFVTIDKNGFVVPVKYATGIARSTDGGTVWMSLPSDSLTSVSGLVTTVTGRFLHESMSLIAAARGGAVYQSTDLGASWMRVGTSPYGSPFTALISVVSWRMIGGYFTAHTTLYGSVWMDVVYSSDDLGVTWNKVGTGFDALATGTLCSAGSTLLAGTVQGVYRLTAGDSTWHHVSSGVPQENIPGMLSVGSTILAGGQSLGIFRSENSGLDWKLSSAGLSGYDAHHITFTDSSLIASGTSSALNWGRNQYYGWIAASGADYSDWSVAVPVRSEILCLDRAGTSLFAGSSNGLYQSTDNGVTWQGVGTGLPANCQMNSMVHTPSALYLGTSQWVYKSTDQGLTWTKCGGAMPDSIITKMYTTTEIVGHATVTTLYAGTSTGGLYYSGTGGNSWVTMSIPAAGQKIKAMAAMGSTLLASTADHVFRTTNLGATWSIADSGMPAYHPITSLCTSGSTFFIAGSFGVYRSGDGGLIWQAIKEGLAYGSVEDMGIWRDTLYASVANAGVWRRPLSEVVTAVSADRASTAPTSFALEQNYPNPFNPQTTIRFAIPRHAMVSLIVYDLLGRKVDELLQGEKEAGVYEVSFNGERAASGVYFYTLRAGEFVQTKRFILLK